MSDLLKLKETKYNLRNALLSADKKRRIMILIAFPI